MALTLTAYYLLPWDDTSGRPTGLRVGIAVVIVVAVVLVSVRSVLRATYPILRAVEATIAIVVLALIAFASSYLAISANDPSSFSEPLDHTGSLYFALTTMTTVGFGDITPKSDAARIVVMIQMVTTVAVVGVGARALLRTAGRRVGAP